MVAVLYLQYYGLYLLAATVIAGSAAAVSTRSWHRLRATLALRFGLCRGIFAVGTAIPLPARQHTGAPWAPRPSVLDFFGDSFNALASAAWAAIVIAIVVAVLSRRNPTPTAVRRNDLTGSPLALAAAVALITLLLAWSVGQFVNSWDPRYLGIAVVPALVPLAGGLVRVRWGALVLWGAVAAMACTALPVVVDRSVTVQTSKSDAAYLLDHLRPMLRPGALVISTEVTDAPVLARRPRRRVPLRHSLRAAERPPRRQLGGHQHPPPGDRRRLQPGAAAGWLTRRRPGARSEPHDLGWR